MGDDFSKYESMRSAGSSPEQVFKQSVLDGLDAITRIRLLRTVFSLSLVQAKEVIVRVEEGRSLEEHQDIIADSLLQQANKRLQTN